jgi:hypothetical protein
MTYLTIVVCRFRKALNHSGAWEVLLNQINSQLTGHGVLVKQGAAMINASVTPTLRKPKGKSKLYPGRGARAPTRQDMAIRRRPRSSVGEERR